MNELLNESIDELIENLKYFKDFINKHDDVYEKVPGISVTLTDIQRLNARIRKPKPKK
jgi:hypothetical protein